MLMRTGINSWGSWLAVSSRQMEARYCLVSVELGAVALVHYEGQRGHKEQYVVVSLS